MSKKSSAINSLIPNMAAGTVNPDDLDFSSSQLSDALDGEEILSEDMFEEVDTYVEDAEREESERIAQERQAENLETATKKVKKKKKAKWYHLLAAALLLLVISIFVVWHLIPKRIMEVTVLDKTVLSYSRDNGIIKQTVYRKHQGLYWILEQQRYVKTDGSFYDFKKDYYGPMLDEEGSYNETVYLKNMNSTPDLMYISDAYGVVDDTYGYYHGNDPDMEGISQDDMSAISYAYENGATVVAETALFSTAVSESVYSQLTSLCGVTPTEWVGRYIFDLEDFSDVPDWAPPMYEQQEGVEWRFTGPGILLVSRDGRIIILEQNTDFNSKNLLRISINKEYRGEFWEVSSANFYNWFELVEPNYGTEQIATFTFDLNAVGMEKIKGVLRNGDVTTPRFCAVTRKTDKNHAPVYFFSGDFNDYTSGHRYGRFLFANQIFKLFSFDRQGDVTNFYWNFYNPLMRKILKDIETTEYIDNSTEDHLEISRVYEDSFQVMKNGEWQDIDVKAVTINAIEPGEVKYSRDMTYYDKLISLADSLGANCICAKTLLPPEFYSAVTKHNRASSNKLYILQTVPTPADLHPEDYVSEEGLTVLSDAITQTIAALHGDCSAQNEFMDEAVYFTDASAYLLGVTIDPGLDEITCFSAKNARNFEYKGTYTKEQSGLSAFCAYLYDTAQKYNYEQYGYFTPFAVRSQISMVKQTGFALSNQAYLFTGIVAKDAELYYYNDIFYDATLIDRTVYKTMDEYDGLYSVFTAIKKQTSAFLLTGITFSDANAVFGNKATTETEQGNKITNLLAAARDAEILGTCIHDLNDTWYDVSDDMYFATVPVTNKHMWHNVCDAAEMTGLVAAEASYPEKATLVLSDDDRAERISMYSNEEYMYITLELLYEIDFTTETMFLGIDTYQRNDGEYFYSSKFTMNSLSGMEFVLEFKGKQDVTLYCLPSYNRTKDHAYTEEAYKGKFNRVAKLSYGGFNVGDNQFYQTSSTIYIRLPWTWLNVTDPSNRLVMADEGPLSKQPRTMTTNGMLISVMIGENATGDNLYNFPQSKHDPGYKMFKWSPWEIVSYSLREKDSYTIVQNFYIRNQGDN